MTVQVTFLDATGIDPEVLESVAHSLLIAEFDLVVTRLYLASVFHDIFKCDFLAVSSPSMWKYRIVRDVVIVIFYQTQVAVSSIYEKAHDYNICCKAQKSVIVGRWERSTSSLCSDLNRTRGWVIGIAENIAMNGFDVEVC
jgi:hypothetical protein